MDYAPSGMETYSRNLVPALASLDPSTQYRLCVRRAWPDWSRQRNVTTFRPLWPFPRAVSENGWIERADKFLWEQYAWPISSRGCQIVHSLYFAAPLVHLAPLVVTVHDCIPLRPEYRRGRIAAIYSDAMVQTARRADAIITVSEHARQEIATAINFPIDRIYVTYEAPSPDLRPVRDESTLRTTRARYNLPDRYLLCFSGERRKNIVMLLRAWQNTRSQGAQLVVIGASHEEDPLYPNIHRLAQELGLTDTIRFISRVDSNDLASLYSAALALCYPSRYEGFGLPPLEAMACSTAVLAARASSIPEVVGDGAHLIDPDDIENWASCMERVISDDTWRNDLVERGSRRVRHFSWRKTAAQTLSVYDALVAI